MLRIGSKAGMVAAVAAAGLLAACSSGGGGGSSSSAATSSAATSSAATSSAASDITIGVSFYTERIPMYATMRQGIEAAAAEAGVKVIIQDANFDPAAQTDQIASMVTQGAKAIIASPIDAKAMVPAYDAARKAGVKMISAANKVDDASEDAYVGPDLVGYAQQTMQQLIDGIGGEGEILILSGPPTIAFVQLQQAGWDAALKANPKVKVASQQVVDDLSTAKAVDVATAALQANPNVKAILSSTDDISVGAIQAMKGLGIDPGKVYTAGWDAQQNGIDLIKAGEYDLTLSYLAYQWGVVAFNTALEFAKGNAPADHWVKTEGLFINDQNVNTLTPEQISGQMPL